jgi:hypothetical protein
LLVERRRSVVSPRGLISSADAFVVVLSSLDPRVHEPAECVELVETLARVEKACAAARTRVAMRAAECDAQRSKGFADPADWLARATGTSTAEASRALDTAKQLDEHPDTR